jgi:hypothetical protein
MMMFSRALMLWGFVATLERVKDIRGVSRAAR